VDLLSEVVKTLHKGSKKKPKKKKKTEPHTATKRTIGTTSDAGKAAAKIKVRKQKNRDALDSRNPKEKKVRR